MSTSDRDTTAALMANCACGHLVMHGWHLKHGCQFDDCDCQRGAGAALLASDWLAAREAEAAARALEEAAEEFDLYLAERGVCMTCEANAVTAAEVWLRARAALKRQESE